MIHHVALASDWDAAQTSGSYERSTLGRSLAEVGFIHASDSYEQTARVVRYLFDEVDAPMVLVSLDPAALAAAGLRVEHEAISPSDPTSEHFPHVYGGALPVALAARVQRFDTTADLLRALDAGERTDSDASARH